MFSPEIIVLLVYYYSRYINKYRSQHGSVVPSDDPFFSKSIVFCCFFHDCMSDVNITVN